MIETSNEERAEVVQPFPFINNFNLNPSRIHPWQITRVLPNRRRSIATTSITAQQEEIQQISSYETQTERPLRRSICVPQYLGLRQVRY